MFGIDPLYWMMMAPILVLSLWASYRVKSNFNKFSRVGLISGMTGAEAAEKILRLNGLHDIRVERADGFLSDHYDPSRRVIRLSSAVYGTASIAAVGVAAHEAGHALQHAKGYTPLMLRNTMAPLASFGSWMSYIIILAGFLLGMLGLAKIGIVLFTVVVFFQIITLPVEFNASARAKELVMSYNMVSQSEMRGINAVLNAAALTYVAAAASAVMTLLYYVIQLGLLGGRDD